MTALFLPLKALTADAPFLRFRSRFAAQVSSIKQSIARDGLFNPLVVIKKNKKFEVVDGKKRLQALKALSKSPLFSRALTKIPCILKDLSASESCSSANDRPSLMTEAELAEAILIESQKGTTNTQMSDRFNCSLEIVEDASTLHALGPKVRKCFADGSINLKQAAALATIPNPAAQWNLLLHLGPFVSDKAIIEAIRNGETVIELPNDNILIVPSRSPSPLPKFGSPVSDTRQDIFTQCLAA